MAQKVTVQYCYTYSGQPNEPWSCPFFEWHDTGPGSWCGHPSVKPTSLTDIKSGETHPDCPLLKANMLVCHHRHELEQLAKVYIDLELEEIDFEDP